MIVTMALLFALLTVGAFVTVGGYGDACGYALGQDYPLCNGNLYPGPNIGQIAEYTHRVLASFSSLFLFITTFLYWRSKESPVDVRRSLYVATVLIILEVVLGAAVVATIEPPWLVTVHQANALLVFGFAVAALAFDYGASRKILPAQTSTQH